MKNKVVIELIPGISEGGAETLVKDYCLFLKQKGLKMKVVTLLPPSKDSANYNILLKNGIEVTSLDKHRWFYSNWLLRNLWRYTMRPIYASYQLAKIIKHQHPNCIHVHMRMLEYLLRISFLLKGIKLFYTCHNEPHLFFENKKSYLEKRAAIKLIRNNGLQLIALHDEMRKELNHMFNVNNTIVIHNGVDFSRFENVRIDKDAYRNSIGLSSEDFIVGHIGRFNKQKNHTFLLKIFALIVEKKSNAKLLLIGDGALRNQVEKEIDNLNLRNKCVILEHRADIPQLLASMDVFLFPSLFEGLPVTLVEAQVVGIRCVVSNTITKECFFNNRIIPIGLEEPIDIWANAVLDQTIQGPYEANIMRFDMNSEINHLGQLYTNEI